MAISKSLCESFLNYPVPAKREQELHESFLDFDTEVELTADA